MKTTPQKGLILSAPSSGSGKTTLTLGLLRALTRRGVSVSGAKSGPDYIDPRFHAAACGRECPNLDAWAMTPDRVRSLLENDDEFVLIEGAMGLFDGAPPEGRGATADLARILHLPVVLVMDCARLAHSVAPIVMGFANFDPEVHVAGVILNNVGSPRHEAMLRTALKDSLIPVLGAVYRQSGMEHPSRHLGLVQAGEHPELQTYLDRVATAVEEAIDLDQLLALCAPPLCVPCPAPASSSQAAMPPKAHRQKAPAKRIAVAQDRAFAFAYPHILADWRADQAEILPFSPLRDEAPDPSADFIFLPGGYPELHAKTLSAASTFKTGMIAASCPIYGECGGYMTLGHAITDKDGVRHEMLGLLDLETSFATRKLHLGYRALETTFDALHSSCSAPFTGRWNGHEFHYATTLKAHGTPLFWARDAEGNALEPMGLIQDNVSGSFAHLIDQT